MKKLILIKYAELSTKKDNIGMFIKQLKRNLEEKLRKYHAVISFDKGRMFVSVENSFEKCFQEVLHTFGIHEVEIAYELENNSLDCLESSLVSLIQEKEFHTFKIETIRSDKSYPMKSPEISKYFGGVVLKNKPGVQVDVHHPEVVIHIEIRREHAYLYLDTYKGIGGYPVGTLGKGMLMLSGGIDSPVAGYLAMKR